MKLLLVSLLPWLLLSSEAGSSPVRVRREARPLLGGLVSDLTSPFLNFFRPSKRPRRPQHRPVASAYHHRPAPSHPPPPPVYHHSPAPPPPPQIQVLPAPDLSQEQPAVAPAYEAASEEPAEAPAYQPIYYGQQVIPVYKPQTFEPAPVEPSVVEPAVTEPAVKEAVEVSLAAAVDLKDLSEPEDEVIEFSAEPEDEVIEFTEEPVLAPVEAPVEEDAGRQPKLLVAGQPEGEIIIDLTQDLDLGLDSLGLSNEVEEVEEVLVTGDQSEKEPQIISFKTNQTPSLFAAPQKTNEVISFVPVEPQPAQTVPVLDESSSPASPVSVTPLLQEEDLRSLLQQGEDQLDQLVPLALVDPDTDSADYEEEFALVDVADYSEQDDLIDDLIAGLEVPEDAVVEDITVTENILETIVTSTPSNLPQTTKTDITLTELKAVPPTIAADPVFKEIVSNGEEEKEQVKRGFSNYDPRQNRIYAHKYSDNYSNWYYFRRGY